MGAIKSKVFGETQFEEDYSDQSKIDNDEAFIHEVSIHCKEPSNNQNFKSNQTFSSSLSTLSGTSSFQDINDSNNLTVRNDNTINNNNNNTNEQFNAANKVILITSENNTNSNKKHNSNNNNNSGNNKTSSHHFPLLDLAKLESKHQQKIRPYTLFEQNSTKKQIHNTSSKSQPNTAVSTNSFQLQQKQQQQQQQSHTQANKENQQVKMETVPSVTSFQPPNHLQKSQYFRSFRMASRRLFSPNVKKLNNGLEISNENNKSLFKSSEQLSTLKPQPKPRVSVESILQTSNSTFENNHNNNNNYFTSASSAKNNMNKINPATINTNTSTTAPATQSNLIHNDTDRIETNVVNLDINIKLDKFETQINDNISNVINTSASTNHLDINNHSSLSQKQTLPRQPPPLPLPPKNLKSKSTVDFSQPKYQSSSIQTSATSTKLVDTVSTNYNNNNSNNNNSNIKNNTGANIQNKSFRNLNFNHSGYFSSIKKRFTPQSNVKDTSSTETVNTLKNSAKEPTIEPEMITMFDPSIYEIYYEIQIMILAIS
jgi:hypothetical protein